MPKLEGANLTRICIIVRLQTHLKKCKKRRKLLKSPTDCSPYDNDMNNENGTKYVRKTKGNMKNIKNSERVKRPK